MVYFIFCIFVKTKNMSKPKDINALTSIYVLKDPRNNEIRYVGRTSQPLNYRLKAHIGEARKHIKHVSNWIRSLTKLNLCPVIEELDSSTWSESAYLEVWYISLIKSWGYKLCNHTEGGEGAVGNIRSTKTKLKHLNSIMSKAKKVYQYKLDGTLIKEWLHAKEASNGDINRYNGIMHVCSGKRRTYHGFIWSYDLRNDLAWQYKEIITTVRPIVHKFTGKRVICNFRNGSIKKFKSILEAATYFNCSELTISELCNGNRSKSLTKIRFDIDKLYYE